jgi:hypothetical protein
MSIDFSLSMERRVAENPCYMWFPKHHPFSLWNDNLSDRKASAAKSQDDGQFHSFLVHRIPQEKQNKETGRLCCPSMSLFLSRDYKD